MLVESARILTSGFIPFLVAGLVVFVPVGLIEGLGLNAADVDGLHGPSAAAVVSGAVLFGSASLLGEILYSGMVTRGVADERRHETHRLGEVLGELPYLRLIAADLLVVVAVTAGLVFLVFPGLILLVLFGLVAPVIEIEPVEPAQRPDEDLLDSEDLAAELGLSEEGEVTELEGFGPSFAEELEELTQEIESGEQVSE